MQRFYRFFHCGLLTAMLLLGRPALSGERPSAPELLPAKTLVMVRITDASTLADRFRETALGRILRDPQMKPLFDDLYGSATDAFAPAAGRLDLSLDQLLKVPQGELCLALVAPDGEGRPAFVLLLQADDNIQVARKLIVSGEEAIVREGAQRQVEKIAGTELNVFANFGRRNRRNVAWFEKDKAICLATDVELARHMLAIWHGADGETLDQNSTFQSTMRRCRVDGEPSQIQWFIDPISIFKTVAQRNSGMQLAEAFLPVLGLDGVKAVGGGFSLATGEFDAVSHIHVTLDAPRRGVLELIAVGKGDTSPESWVPQRAASYATLHWDVTQTWDKLAEVFDSVRGDGAMKSEVDRSFSKPLGVDFHEDIVKQLSGRFSLVGWVQRPARLNARAHLLGAQLLDEEAGRETIAQVVDKLGDQLTEDVYRSVTWYQREGGRPRNGRAVSRDNDPEGNDTGGGDAGRNAAGRNNDDLVRRASLCFAQLGNYLLVADSPRLLKEAIDASRDESKSLAGDLEFRLVASKIKRFPGGDGPGMLVFNRPEEGLRTLYDLATADTMRTRLTDQSANNRLFGALNRALTNHPLPEFSVWSKYIAPGGSLLTSDESGIHFVDFTLRRE